MKQLKSAIVKGNWAGDYQVIEPGRYEGQEIIKPCLIYSFEEVREIGKRIAAQSGQDPENVIRITNNDEK